MENVAHALSGLLVAELIVSTRPDKPSPTFGRALYWIGAITANLPDADILYVGFLGGKLGYLLHHRGHTHTLAIGMLLGLIVSWLFVRRRSASEWTSRERRWAYGLGLFGPALHMAMDGWNNYGVHPFWPLDGRWYSGDAVFIVEPLLWLVGIPAIYFGARSKGLRWTLAGLWLLMVFLVSALRGVIPLGAALVCVAIGVGMVLLSARLGRAQRARLGIGAFFAVAAVFIGFSLSARAAARSAFIAAVTPPHASMPDPIVDLSLTPSPADPTCWTGHLMTRDADSYSFYRFRLGVGTSLAGCPRAVGRSTLKWDPGLPPSERFEIVAQKHFDLARLRAIAARCDGAAFLRYSPWPYFDDAGSVLGDARFDRTDALDFADIELEEAPRCPRLVPDWVMPRADLLDF